MITVVLLLFVISLCVEWLPFHGMILVVPNKSVLRPTAAQKRASQQQNMHDLLCKHYSNMCKQDNCLLKPVFDIRDPYFTSCGL